MQQISSNYKNEIKQPSRHFECRVTIGKNIYTNESIVDIILDYPQVIDGFSIGNTTSQSLDLTLLNTGEEIYSTNQIKVEIGLQVDSDFEYILMGYYNVDEVSKNDYTIKFTAFDNMMKFETPYFSSLGDKATLQQVVNELATITGVSFTGSVPNYTVTKLEGYTCREVLSYVASLCGGNALITRDGKFTIKTLQVVDCSVTTENHFGLTTEEVPYKIGKITCVVDSEIELSKGATGIDSMELSFENPWMTESILNTLYQQLNDFSYLGFQTKWQGDLALDPYDLISIQDKKGTSYQVPILNQKFTYVGGLTSEIAAQGESKNKNSFSSSGPSANRTNRLVTEQAIIKEALINKANIQDLEAVSIRTQSLEATTAKIQDAIIDVAHISDLNAVNAKIESLQATDVTIQNAIINKADISELNAAVANINILNADLGVIKHLVNGNLSSENIQAGGITSDKLTIANGFIKDAMIDSLNANKITAGQINTALVQVSSSSGNLVINDNTVQIRDANRVRVQIGKDASNDYSMSVWDSNGKLMFDARGLKADAIKDSIIRDDMVAPGANIDGSKLNISSVVSSINNSSSTLKASKVQFDGVAQTLEVAFNTLKTQADTTKIQTESNTTAISVAQGEIKTLIQDTTIVKDGIETKLKDEYSRLEQTVGNLSSTIGSQQTIIDDHTGKITLTNSELSTLKQSVNGLSASVSSAQATIESHSVLISQKANSVDVYTKAQTDSAINVAKDEINLGVSSTYETKANVETKVSSTLSSAKSYADTKKTEAINSANSTLNSTIANYYTKSQTDSQINVAKNEITQSVASTYETKTDSTTKYDTATAIAKAMNEGKVLYTDIAFRTGSNSVGTYNNTGNGNTVVERITKPSDCPTTSTHCIRITHKGIASPGLGGFVQSIPSRANAVFIQKFVAMLPSGYTLNTASNSMGSGYSDKWLTSNKGTGKWETYIRQVACGSTGTFSNGGHVYVSGTTPTTDAPLVWYLASCTAIDITDTDERISTLTTRMNSAEQKITDSAIINTVKSQFYTKTENDSKMSSVESSITQLSNQIQSKVDANGVKSVIEQNPSSVQVGFNKISDALTISADGLLAKTQSGNKYFQLGYDGIIMYNPANGTHQWGKFGAINSKFTVASNGNSSGLSLGHHVNENYVEDILCDSSGVVTVRRQMNHNGILYNNYGHVIIRQSGQGGWEITGRSDSQSIKPGGANQGALGSSTQYINQSWIANRYNPSSLELKHVSHYIDDLECLKLVSEIQPARYFYKEFDDDGNDITTFTTRNSQIGLIYEDVRECAGRDYLTNEEEKAINDYNMSAVLWGATRNINHRLNDVEHENLLLRERVEQLERQLEQLVN